MTASQRPVPKPELKDSTISAQAATSTTESTKQNEMISPAPKEDSPVKPTPKEVATTGGKRELDATNMATEGSKNNAEQDGPMRMEELRKEEEAFKEALDRMNAKIGNLHREINKAPIGTKPEDIRASRTSI